MRLMPRILTGVALMGSTLLLPISGAVHAAPLRGGSGGPVIVVQAPNVNGQGQIKVGLSLENIAAVEGVSTAVLQQDLQAGETLLQIAAGRYSSAQDLATALLANLKTKLDTAATSGKFTAAQESQLYAALLSATETLVTTPHPVLSTEFGADKGGVKGKGMEIPINIKQALLSTVAASCNTTADALMAALQAGGKSVLAVCQATNPSATVASLSAAVTTAVKGQLDAAVAAGKITASQESAVLADLQTSLASWLTTPVNADGAGNKA